MAPSSSTRCAGSAVDQQAPETLGGHAVDERLGGRLEAGDLFARSGRSPARPGRCPWRHSRCRCGSRRWSSSSNSAASAVSSTAAVIIVTVCACSSIASRMRSAEVWTSSTVPWIEPLASTVWRVACWIAVILAVMSSVARAVCEARLFTSCATTAKPRPASPARAASIVALSARRLVWPAMSRIRLEDRFDRFDVGATAPG